MKDGQCVRLRRGGFKDITVYSDAPWKVAAWWQAQGGTFLHLMDLDGALAGHSVNAKATQKIMDSVTTPTEAEGGIRSREVVYSMLDLGVRCIIVGTKAATHPEFLRGMVEKFGEDAIVAGVDARDGMVTVEGWEKVSAVTARDPCMKMEESGARRIVYTSISRDGMPSGPDVEAARQLTEDMGFDIIASDGALRMKDLQDLYKAGIRGIIIEKIPYESRTDLKEAVRLYENQEVLK